MGKLKDALSGMFNPLGKKPETRKENAAELKPDTPPVPQEEPVGQQPETSPAPLKELEKPQPATPAEPVVSLGHFKDKADVEETIGDCLVRQMSKFIGGTGYPDLTIWIDDPIAVQLATKEFQDYLKKLLLHNGCRPQSNKTVLTVRAGDELRVVEETSRGCLVKKDGVSGWYFGKLRKNCGSARPEEIGFNYRGSFR